jgi:hypothetical protein
MQVECHFSIIARANLYRVIQTDRVHDSFDFVVPVGPLLENFKVQIDLGGSQYMHSILVPLYLHRTNQSLCLCLLYPDIEKALSYGKYSSGKKISFWGYSSETSDKVKQNLPHYLWGATISKNHYKI